MVLLILAILFAIASAIGYIRDRNDEAREKRWTSTLASSFCSHILLLSRAVRTMVHLLQ